MKKGILLIGPYYAGKTTCSKEVASSCNWKRYDLDDIYTEKYEESIWATRNIKNNKALSSQQRDKIGFEIINNIKNEPENSIVVFGGGSFFNDHPEQLDIIKSTHTCVYLFPTRQTLVERAMNDKEFGVNQFLFRDADNNHVDKYFEQLHLKKGSDYLKWADRIIEPNHDWSVEKICFKILSCYFSEKIK